MPGVGLSSANVFATKLFADPGYRLSLNLEKGTPEQSTPFFGEQYELLDSQCDDNARQRYCKSDAKDIFGHTAHWQLNIPIAVMTEDLDIDCEEGRKEGERQEDDGNNREVHKHPALSCCVRSPHGIGVLLL